MSTACGRPQGARGVRPIWTHVDRGEGWVKNLIFCGRHKWMTPKSLNAQFHGYKPRSMVLVDENETTVAIYRIHQNCCMRDCRVELNKTEFHRQSSSIVTSLITSRSE